MTYGVKVSSYIRKIEKRYNKDEAPYIYGTSITFSKEGCRSHKINIKLEYFSNDEIIDGQDLENEDGFNIETGLNKKKWRIHE